MIVQRVDQAGSLTQGHGTCNLKYVTLIVTVTLVQFTVVGSFFYIHSFIPFFCIVRQLLEITTVQQWERTQWQNKDQLIVVEFFVLG